MRLSPRRLAPLLALLLPTAGQDAAPSPHQVVPYFDSHYILAEAENFSVTRGFRARAWGDGNFFCSDLNNVFLSRSAYLQGLANTTDARATATVTVPRQGNYSVLVRYEAVYHFNQGFRVQVGQHGQTLFDAVFGLRESLKLWACTYPPFHSAGHETPCSRVRGSGRRRGDAGLRRVTDGRRHPGLVRFLWRWAAVGVRLVV
eukprot:COSAG04_NODE_340_length_16315_cov_1278.534410_7_plen_202_part_00